MVSRPEIGNKHNVLEAGRTGLPTLALGYSGICLRTTGYEQKQLLWRDIHPSQKRMRLI